MLKTGHRTKYHLRAFEFLAARRRSRAVLTCTLLASFLATMPTGGLQAGDILRGGASAGNAKRNSDARANAGAAAAEAAKVKAQDRLARTTKAVNDMRALQASARAASANTAFNGLYDTATNPNGGLKVLTGANAKWEGADAPTAAGNNVNIKQNASQALLHWDTFNVGSQTTVNFDQSAGGADSGKWIAFNKVVGASTAPSQIRGKINAQGQVYIINQNGIIFGAGSQVNARTLVASALPINDNLVKSGLLNNKGAQFLFSGLTVPGGSGDFDDTSDFTPTPLPDGAKYGDVVVERGALLETPTSADGNGGRIMLVGANVRNEGQISTPAGQTILAAGLQVGIQSHKSDDPSLRGLDVWVGSVGDYAGEIKNSGLIESKTGSILLTGKQINHSGVLESSTTVSLNGRIDLFASYGAVGNPGFDNDGTLSSYAPFIPQFTGIISMASSSVIRILPSTDTSKKVPGTRLPELSQINFIGKAVYFGEGSMTLAPNAQASIRAGVLPFLDTDQNRIADDPFLEKKLERDLSKRLPDDPIWGYTSNLLYSEGQVYFDRSSLFDVSGTVGAFVPFKDYIVDVQFRGNELADSPLQRTSKVRGKNLTVDLRKSGTYGGAGWVGSPLGDLNGIAGAIARDAGQLTAAGGEISVNAGNSIVIASGAILDVSGGSLQYEGGIVATSRLIRNGVSVPIHQATPDRIYDSIMSGSFTQISMKWGVSKTFLNPLSPTRGYLEPSYIGGASAGTIRLTAPGLLVAGELIGQSINGPRQRETVAERSLLKLSFRGEKNFSTTALPSFLVVSPYPPKISATTSSKPVALPAFELVADSPKPVAESYLTSFTLPTSFYEEDEGGFGSVEIINEGGDFVVDSSVQFKMTTGSGLKASARNVNIAGSIIAPGGTVSLTAYNYSPYIYSEKALLGEFTNLPPPNPLVGTGLVSIFSGGSISVAGSIIDDRPTSSQTYIAGKNIHGGTILLEGYGINSKKDSTLDASAGAYLSFIGKKTNGNGGKIQLFAGVDPGLSTSIGGKLELGGTLKGYGFGKGGTLALKSTFVQIGGGNAPADTLLLNPSFFQSGGFSNFEINGIGGRTDSGAMRPAIKLVAGTILEPRAESLLMNRFGGKNGAPTTYIALKQEGIRPPTSITLKARGSDDEFADPVSGLKIEALGLIVLEKGSKISTDPGASVVIDGDAIYANGSIVAPGGKISMTGRSKFWLTSIQSDNAIFALPTVYIGSSAQISTAGTSVALPDPYGRRTGILYPGGTISIAGNILAESGAVLNVSGASAEFDLHPNRAGMAQNSNPYKKSGVTSGLWQLLSQPVQVDSDGGTIRLAGSEFVYSSATLEGAAGGPTALGGALSISSSRFYHKINDLKKGSDINMVVKETGDALAFGGFSDSTTLLNDLFLSGGNFDSTIGNAFANPKTNPGMGFFAVEQFTKGGFDSLDLNFYLNRGAPTLGGNIEFQGPVSIKAPGFLRLAGGGVIKSDSAVSLQAAYVAIGQEFRPPLNPSDTTQNAIIHPYEEERTGSGVSKELVVPESGAGSLNIQASLIDLGTLTLKGISRANLSAPSGDVRGSGTVSIAGDLSITAAQVYPTTLATLDIFAYAGGGSLGKVTISASGTNALPLSAGGSLRIFANTIQQSGVLRAPFGSITLGWDGLDTDPSDSDLDAPVNSSVGSLLSTPIASSITLAAGSTTSVSSIDPLTGEGIVVPFGLSPDGLSWLDPRGVNVTTSGLPTRRIQISGDSITSESGSVIDLRGGGDLLGYRWLPGIGGTSDILGLGATAWQAKSSYNAGDLVMHNGSTWSARVSIAPEKIFDDTTPSAGRYWKLVPESFAVIPGFGSNFAPYNAFNTGDNASGLGGSQGFVSNSLRIGQKVSLTKGSALAEGTYTLLPRRYGVLPGAYLVLPTDGNLRDSSSTLDLATLGYRSPGLGGETIQETGSSFVSGHTFNSLHGGDRGTPVSRTFEILTPELLAERASYETYSANSFIPAAAARLSLTTRQTLPIDSGHLSFLGKSGLNLSGTVYGKNNFGGYGAQIDVASLANIVIQGAGSSSVPSSSVALSVSTLNSWGAESLLIGGTRKANSDGSATLTARTPSLTLDNSQTPLSAPDVSLVSLGTVKLLAGSRVQASGTPNIPSSSFTISGDGALVRASGNTQGSFSRTGVTGSAGALLEIGANAAISGGSVVLDSSYASDINPNVSLEADFLSLRSGQISIVYGTPTLTGAAFTPHLVLSGSLLEKAANSQRLELQSYRTIDLYGDGVFGGSSLASLSLKSSGVRGFAQGAGGFKLTAGEVTLSNPDNAIVLSDSPNSGTLSLEASKILLGANAFSVSGYNNLNLIAPSGVLATKTGSLRTTGGLSVTTSLLTTTSSSSYSISASNQFDLLPSTATPAIEKGLGGTLYLEGQSIAMGSSINLPSGLLTLRAKGRWDSTLASWVDGDLNITGSIKAENISKQFQDVTKSTNAGEVRLVSDTGNINLSGSVSVSATSGDGAAGILSISAPGGAFASSGTFQGRVAPASSASGGSFALDVGSLASFSILQDKLTEGGFTESWNLRRRTGAWELTGVSKAAELVFSADAESIIVDGTLDASGITGGNIGLYSRGSVIVKGDSKLTVRAEKFNNAGKGGSIRLEAGAVNSSASANLAGFVTLETGSEIDLGVTEFRSGDYAGDYTDPTSSAFYGKFQGKLQIRAPRSGADLLGLNVNPLLGEIKDASAVTVEAFRVYTPSDGTLNTTVRDAMNSDNTLYMNTIVGDAVNEVRLRSNLLTGNADATNLDKILVIMPGVELLNPTGSLTLGSAGDETGTPSSEAWDLANYRYGSRNSPGVLTLRAKDDVLIQNAISDGFEELSFQNNGGSTPVGARLWLSELMDIQNNLPVNLPVNSQSWSYRIVSGADLGSAYSMSVLPLASLGTDLGSVKLGNFYSNAGLGWSEDLQAAYTLAAIASGSNTRFQVIRTGAGDISIATGRDFQLRNQFASVYTAGVRILNPTKVFETGDFSTPITQPSTDPEQGELGEPQQKYAAQWGIGGGDLHLESQGSMKRITLNIDGEEIPDSSRQMPNNWLYRRGKVDSNTGLFARTRVVSNGSTINDSSSSTTWWVDYSNFFEGLGAFAGGNIRVKANGEISNIDALIPTTARMPGLSGGNPIAPDSTRLVEYGGGDLLIKSNNDLSGGVYYVEKGTANIQVGGSITTNQARSPSLYYYEPDSPAEIFDQLTWLPTTFFAGKSEIYVTAKGDALLGPVANVFLTPPGVNNKYWYKTYFHTFAENTSLNAVSLGGDIINRHSIVMPGDTSPSTVLKAWFKSQTSLVNIPSTAYKSHPWIRIAELFASNSSAVDEDTFTSILSLSVPTWKSTSFSGDIKLSGDLNLFPSRLGTVELFAKGSVYGMNPVGRTTLQGINNSIAWASSKINLSDANPSLIPSVAKPFAYQEFINSIYSDSLYTTQSKFLYSSIDRYFQESGETSGFNTTIDAQSALHSSSPIHQADTQPLRIHAMGGDVTGLTLFSSKFVNLTAGRDVTDIAFYIQNAASSSVSIIAAGRDVIPYNENSERRTSATIKKSGDAIVDPFATTTLQNSRGALIDSQVLAGDIQISGLGALEVIAGRNIDFGTGPNFQFGRGVGITTIGKTRNPFLPKQGADILLFTGLSGIDGGAALGILGSPLNLVAAGLSSSQPTSESQAITAYRQFFGLLRTAGDEYLESGSYDSGFEAISSLYGNSKPQGELFTRSRDLRTTSGGAITISIPGGGLTMASTIFGNPLTPPGIVTEYGGEVSVFTDRDVDIGQARIFTLRGGDMTIWSSYGDIAAGTAPKTVVTAPPTRVLIDSNSADIVTDLGGLATGGGIGVLASVEGVEEGNVSLLAPFGTVDAGDAGIRATGNIKIAAAVVLNADNIAAGGSSTGVPSAPTVAAPNVGGLTSGSSSSAAANSAASQVSQQAKPQEKPVDESPSMISVEILGYGGGEGDKEEEKSASL